MGLSKISVVLICALWFLMVHYCHAQDPMSMLTQAPMSNLIPAPMIQGDKTPDKDDKTPDKDDRSKEDKTSDKDNMTPDKDNKSKDTVDKTSDKDNKTKDKEVKTPEKDDKDKDESTKDTVDKTAEKDDKDKDEDDKTPDKDKTQQPKDTHKSNDKNLDNKTPNPKDSAPEPQGVPQPQDAPQPQDTPQRKPQAISPTASGNSPQDWVEAHNAHRRLENVVLMTWNVSLAQYAQTYVKTIAPTCKPKHSGGPWGECLFMGDGAATAKEIVDYWASEKKYWDPKTKKCQDGQDCGHYLQVVNPNSPAVGCGKAKCANDPFYWFVICDYIW